MLTVPGDAFTGSASGRGERSRAVYCIHLGSGVDGEQRNGVHPAGGRDVQDGPLLPANTKEGNKINKSMFTPAREEKRRAHITREQEEKIIRSG